MMESAKNKVCPINGGTCEESSCAWWCCFAKDCAVPLIAGILADSSICQTRWKGGASE